MANILARCFVGIFMVHFSWALTTIQENNFATIGHTVSAFTDGPSLSAAADKYIFAFDELSSRRVLVSQRDLKGSYATYYETPWPRTPGFLTTNGKWFGSLGSGFINSFQLGEGGTFNNMTEFTSLALFMQFFSDDTLVLINETVIETYEFTTDQWTMIQSQPVNFTVITYFTRFGEPADSAPHVTDTTLAAYHPRGAVELYRRNEDKSWTLVDEISIDTSQYRANRILWDGDDTVVLGHTTFLNSTTNVQGRIMIFTKISGSWTLTSVIEGSSLGIPAYGYFAYSMLLVNQDLIAIGAPASLPSKGQAFLLERSRDGTWQITIEFSSRASRYSFGNMLMKTNYELLIHTGEYISSEIRTQNVVAISGCRLPASYSCSDVILDSCSEIVNIPYDRMYSVVEFGPCTEAALISYHLVGQRITFTIGLTRNSVTSFCNSTITCLNYVPTDAPLSTAPNATPMSSTVPIASNVPSTPDSTSQTSSASHENCRINTKLFLIVVCVLSVVIVF